jgi:small subunit ribosomal protein S8e
MGVGRDSRHKRRLTGGRMPIHKKKRAFEKARPIANTKLTQEKDDIRVRPVPVRGGNYKFRALRLNEGNFAWASEGIARKTKIVDVVYNASNNELVRTKTLVKNAIVQIDAAPFKSWYLQHYGVEAHKSKSTKKGAAEKTEDKKTSRHVKAKLAFRNKERKLDQKLEDQFANQRVLASISSRPGQSGRADGYILEGKELEFYVRKIEHKRKQ